MQGSILILDGIATNRILLKVKLRSSHYDVIQSDTIAHAKAAIAKHRPDLIISAIDLPDGPLTDLCRELAAHPATADLPVIAIQPRQSMRERIDLLRSGARDVISGPIEQTLLLARVRSLIRASHAEADWLVREHGALAMGFAEPGTPFDGLPQCVLMGSDPAQLQRMAGVLRPLLPMKLSLSDCRSVAEPGDIFVLALSEGSTEAADTLRVIARLRANHSTRHAAILVVQSRPEPALAADALDMGADDLMPYGFEAAELAIRLNVLLRRKRMADNLRAAVQSGLKEAVRDPLTGLHNRRYAMPQLDHIDRSSQRTGQPFALMVADLDHFKQVNDRYGHASGDAVLCEVARRLGNVLRSTDLLARIGGEEFLIAMPATDLARSKQIATRICAAISDAPFPVPGSAQPIEVTISIGMIMAGAQEDAACKRTGAALLERADQALYAAKGHGRNRVTLGRPAA